jgi:hypothetical protein
MEITFLPKNTTLNVVTAAKMSVNIALGNTKKTKYQIPKNPKTFNRL